MNKSQGEEKSMRMLESSTKFAESRVERKAWEHDAVGLGKASRCSGGQQG